MSQANVINNDRHTVGLSIPAFGSPHLVLRDQGTISDLGALGGAASGATGINNHMSHHRLQARRPAQHIDLVRPLPW